MIHLGMVVVLQLHNYEEEV